MAHWIFRCLESCQIHILYSLLIWKRNYCESADHQIFFFCKRCSFFIPLHLLQLLSMSSEIHYHHHPFRISGLILVLCLSFVLIFFFLWRNSQTQPQNSKLNVPISPRQPTEKHTIHPKTNTTGSKSASQNRSQWTDFIGRSMTQLALSENFLWWFQDEKHWLYSLKILHLCYARKHSSLQDQQSSLTKVIKCTKKSHTVSGETTCRRQTYSSVWEPYSKFVSDSLCP